MFTDQVGSNINIWECLLTIIYKIEKKPFIISQWRQLTEARCGSNVIMSDKQKAVQNVAVQLDCTALRIYQYYVDPTTFEDGKVPVYKLTS